MIGRADSQSKHLVDPPQAGLSGRLLDCCAELVVNLRSRALAFN